eukprot:15347309-Ditylum_brightwellii.AAC.1
MFKDMIKYLQDKEKGGDRIRQFTDKGPCCSITTINAKKEYEIGFNVDNSNIYNEDIDDNMDDIEESSTK